ncbi:MAG TPA: hypothetical protein VFV87_01220 [Pirellulaceae bacterium]|nr:hypothetical protein [Pirellulaceae bacterium]
MPRPTLDVDQTTFAGQVAAEIRRRRLKKFPRAEEAAEAAGVPVKTWYGWETGKVHLDALPLAAAALGCSPRSLLPS